MLRAKDTKAKTPKTLLHTATNVAQAFGFEDMDAKLATMDKKRLAAANKVVHAQKREQCFMPHVRNLASCDAHKCEGHILGYHLTKGNKQQPDTFSMHVVGTESPIAEATLIAAAHTLLGDVGVENPVVHVNSMGAGDSFTRYVRDLTKYLKKIQADLPVQVRTDMSISPARAYARLSLLNKELAEAGPRSVDYLNDEGRSHLWSVLEYLEGAGIPYLIDTSIIGSGDYFEHTVFEVHNPQGDILAHGGRYSSLGRKAYRRHIPSTGIIFELDTPKNLKLPKQRTGQEPSFFFAQLGNGAKKLGLKVLSQLHKAGINVGHAITEESLSTQMTQPLSKQAPYTIIIGHKEALEDAVIVRNTATMHQVTVPVNRLVNYLKRLKV